MFGNVYQQSNAEQRSGDIALILLLNEMNSLPALFRVFCIFFVPSFAFIVVRGLLRFRSTNLPTSFTERTLR